MLTEVFLGITVAYLLVYGFLYTPNTEYICVFLLIAMHLTTLIALVTDQDKSVELKSLVPETYLGDAATVPIRVICMLAVALQLIASIILGNIYAKLCYYQSATAATNGHTLVNLETAQNRADKRTLFQLMVGETCVILALIAATSPLVKEWLPVPTNVMTLGLLFSLAGASICIYMAKDLGVRLTNLYPDLAMHTTT